MRSANIVTLIVPLLIIALAIPLIFQLVPRNWIYGFRTGLTMSSDEIWYYANKVCGLALLAAGIAWLILRLALPALMSDQRSAYRLAVWLGAALTLGGCAVSYWLTYRKYDQ